MKIAPSLSLAALALLAALPTRAAEPGRVYELRTYTAAEGKLDQVLARFRNHTTRIFEKHGIVNIGYWVPSDPPRNQNTLIYIVAHPSREDAAKAWAAFRADPEWQKARAESEANGKIVLKTESVFLTPADFSKLK